MINIYTLLRFNVIVNIKAYLQLVRIHNVVGAAIGDLMGYLVASFWNINLIKLVISIIVVASVAAGGYVINDVFDVEIDKINKPYRPIPSGQVSIRDATVLAYVLFGVGVVLSALLGLLQFVLALLVAISLYYYAKSIKRTGFYGNLLVATNTALSIFYGGLAYFQGEWLIRVIIPTFYSFLLTVSREIVKGIEDVKGDSAHGVKTLAVRLGVTRAWYIAKLLLVFILIISPIPYLLGFNFLYLIFLSVVWVYIILTILQSKSIEGAVKGRSYLKVAAIAGIITFLIGSFPIQLLHQRFFLILILLQLPLL